VTLEARGIPDVGAFLLGAPKSGTTWLASALEQHPGICVSNPKEPNEVATHKGTFDRDMDFLIGAGTHRASWEKG